MGPLGSADCPRGEPCPKCGGPTIPLFTHFACLRDCDNPNRITHLRFQSTPIWAALVVAGNPNVPHWPDTFKKLSDGWADVPLDHPKAGLTYPWKPRCECHNVRALSRAGVLTGSVSPHCKLDRPDNTSAACRPEYQGMIRVTPIVDHTYTGRSTAAGRVP